MIDQIIGYIEDNSVYIGGKKLEPDSSQRLCNYSPDGFNWGYGGAGPIQLALAILFQFRDNEDVIMPVSVVKDWTQKKKQISNSYLKEQFRPAWELNEEYRKLSF